MQPLTLASVALALVSILILQTSTGLAQGSLTPPGPPTPMMKTLAQLEPRAPISSVPFTITEPGSYYLTTNVTVSSGDAIAIATNGVTLDLNGFTISSAAPGAAGTGIRLSDSLQNLALLNGFIQGGVTNGSGVYSGSGFAYGIEYDGTGPANCRLSGVSVSGILYNGMPFFQPRLGLPVYRTTRPEILLLFFSGARRKLGDQLSAMGRAPLKNKKKKRVCVPPSINRLLVETARGKFALQSLQF